MKLPKKVKIGYHDYEIIEWSSKEVELSDTWGQCDKNEKKIYICTEANPRIVADIFIHECFHALWEYFNMEEEESEEKVVSLLSSGLIDIFVSNPQTLKFIADQCGPKNES